MKSYFKTGATLKNLNDRLKLVELIAVGYINSLFVDGMHLPVPQIVTQFLKDPRARHFDSYLFLDAEPDFNALKLFEKKNSTDTEDKLIKNDQIELLTF